VCVSKHVANVERRVSKMHSPLTDMRSICVCVYRLLRNRNVIASLADLCGAYLRQEKVLEATSDFVLTSEGTATLITIKIEVQTMKIIKWRFI